MGFQVTSLELLDRHHSAKWCFFMYNGSAMIAREIQMDNKNLMIVVYTGLGHTYTFYDVTNIKYHNKNLEFDYLGFSGETHAQFNDIVGMTKHKGVANPNKKHNVDKEHYNNLLPCGKHTKDQLCTCATK